VRRVGGRSRADRGGSRDGGSRAVGVGVVRDAAGAYEGIMAGAAVCDGGGGKGGGGEDGLGGGGDGGGGDGGGAMGSGG